MAQIKVKVEFGSEQERVSFCELMEFVRHGKVIVGWEEEPDDEDDDLDSVDVPVYDRSDRSGDPRHALAYAMELCGWYDYFVGEDNSLVVACQWDQPTLLDIYIAAAPVVARRVPA